MLNNLKIATGIHIAIFSLIFLLLGIVGLGYYSANTSGQQFSHFMEVSENASVLNDADEAINRLLEKIYALSLSTSKGEKATTQQLSEARRSLALAQEQLKRFYSQPYQQDALVIVDKIKQQADTLMALLVSRLENINQVDNAVREMNKISAARNLFENEVKQYRARFEALITTIEVEANANNSRFNTLAISAGIIALGLVIGMRLWLKRELFRRLDETVKTFQSMATGKLDEEIPAGKMNEIGLMFIELEKLRQWVTMTVSSIRNGVSRINASAQEIVSGNNELSSRTEQQASSLQQTAASMEELKITVRQNADNAHTARQLAESASGSARNGGEVMESLDAIMHRIIISSRQIDDINSVIDSIANQTNILALNAAVEAARAGEQGRGFAVVAGEVRNLAKRSADAAKEIRSLINTCVADMHSGSQEVEQAGKAIQHIIQSVSQVADIMAEIASASDEQSSGINQIAQAVNELDSVTQQNATMVEQAAAAAISMEEHAGQLGSMVAHIKLKDETSYTAIDYQPLLTPTVLLPETQRKKNELDHINPVEEWESF
ncbi:methyl-accepting chemotaxis protein [Pantoea sp. FN0307]|uniref:methyl-accepting chemotaxis protein n=1 Tax=Pantoea sp. FN0307 TaxID=3418560 RepID=UPI003CEAE1EE